MSSMKRSKAKELWNTNRRAGIVAKREAASKFAELMRDRRKALGEYDALSFVVPSSSSSSSSMSSSSMSSSSTSSSSTSSSTLAAEPAAAVSSMIAVLPNSTMFPLLSAADLVRFDREHVVHPDHTRIRTRRSCNESDNSSVYRDNEAANADVHQSKRQRLLSSATISETLLDVVMPDVTSAASSTNPQSTESSWQERLYNDCLRCLMHNAVPIQVVIGTYTIDNPFSLRDGISHRLRPLLPIYYKLMNTKLCGAERLTVQSIDGDIKPFKFPAKLPQPNSRTKTSDKHLNIFKALSSSRMWTVRCFSCWCTILAGCVYHIRRDHLNVIALLQPLLDREIQDYSAAASPPSLATSSDKLPFCHFCWDRIKDRSQMPSVCMLNGLMLEDVPIELQDLNRMEKRMIARVNLFHNIVILSSSGQRGMKGLSVGFKVSVPALINELPRALNDAGYIVIRPPNAVSTEVPAAARMTMLESRRPTKAMTNYLVRPNKIELALKWLLMNNVIYHDVRVDLNKFAESEDWLECPNVVPSSSTSDIAGSLLESRVYQPPNISLPQESRSIDQLADDNEAELEAQKDRDAASVRKERKKANVELKARLAANRSAAAATAIQVAHMRFDTISLEPQLDGDAEMRSAIAASLLDMLHSHRNQAHMEQADAYEARVSRIIGSDREICIIPGDGNCIFNSVLTGCRLNGISVRSDCNTPNLLRLQTGVFIRDCREEFYALTGTSAEWCSVKQSNYHERISPDVIIPELGAIESRTLDDCVVQMMDTSTHNDWNIPFGLPGASAADVDLFDFIPLVLMTVLSITIHTINRWTSSYADLIKDGSISALLKDRSIMIVHSRACDHWNTVIDCDSRKRSSIDMAHAPLHVHNHDINAVVKKDTKCSTRLHRIMLPPVVPPLPLTDDIAVSSYATFLNAAPDAGIADVALSSVVNNYSREQANRKTLLNSSDDVDMTADSSIFRPVHQLQRVGGRPVTISEQNAHEAFAHPCSYPTGENHMGTKRHVPLSMVKYLRTRLLSPYRDRLIKGDVAWLFFAVQTYQWHQIRNAIMVTTHQRFGNGTGRQPHSDAAPGAFARHNMNCGHDNDDANFLPFSSASATVAKSNPVTAGVVKAQLNDDTRLRNLCFVFLRGIRGTVPYWMHARKDLFAMLDLLGSPTYFVTLSADDCNWIGSLMNLTGKSAVECEAMNSAERQAAVAENPDRAAQYFMFRWTQFWKHVLNGPIRPLGKIKDYFWRVEFQQRGSPHIHMLLWIEDAPDTSTPAGLASLPEFVSNHISCEIPDPDDPADDGLHHLVSTVQQHRCTFTCRPTDKSKCRFGYPKLPCAKTRLRGEADIHVRASDMCIMKRSHINMRTNAYNPILLRAWRANMDIQIVTNAAACIAYIVSYVTKEEPSSLQHVLADALSRLPPTATRWTKLLRLSSAMVGQREVSAQECAFIILGLVYRRASRSFISVNSVTLDRRLRMLKPDWNKEADSSTNIFRDSIFQRYEKRPLGIDALDNTDFENMSLRNYAMWFRVVNKSKPDAGTCDDSVGAQDGEDDNNEPRACNEAEPGDGDIDAEQEASLSVKRTRPRGDHDDVDHEKNDQSNSDSDGDEYNSDNEDTHTQRDELNCDDGEASGEGKHQVDVNPKYHNRIGYYQQQDGGYIRRTNKEQCVQSPHLTVKDGDAFYYSLLLQYVPFRSESKILEAFAFPVHTWSDQKLSTASSLRVDAYPTAKSKFVDCPPHYFPTNKCERLNELIQQALVMRAEDEDFNHDACANVIDDHDNPMNIGVEDVPSNTAWNARMQAFNPEAVNEANEFTIADNVVTSNAYDNHDTLLPIDAMVSASHGSLSSSDPHHVQTYVPTIQDLEWQRRKHSMTASQKVLFDHISKHIKLCDQYREHRSTPGASLCSPPVPLRLFVTGGAGVGKSYMIALIYELLRRTSGNISCMKDSTSNSVCMLMAPTGVAAFNIGGLTIHRALHINVELKHIDCNAICARLTDHEQREYKQEFRLVTHIVIDEVSMVSYSLLMKIDLRCRELSSISGGSDMPFGGFSMILVGDLFQLSPVFAKWIYNRDAATPDSHLWRSSFDMFELIENVRQMGAAPVPPALSSSSSLSSSLSSWSSSAEHEASLQWTSLLNRMRTGNTTAADIKTLLTRRAAPSGPIDSQSKPFINCIHLYSRNDDCDAWNLQETKRMIQVSGIHVDYLYKFNSIDSIRSGTFSDIAGKGASSLASHIPTATRDCGGIPSTLILAVGSRVMLRRNTNTRLGLVNGATGIVTGFTWANDAAQPLENKNRTVEMPKHVWVKFDNPSIGRSIEEQQNNNRRLNTRSAGCVGIQSNPRDNPNDVTTAFHSSTTSVAISPTRVSFTGKNNQCSIDRLMIPLVLSWAVTIHKVQGLTLQNVVVSMKQLFESGMAYVALSRVTKISGLCLLDFEPASASHKRTNPFRRNAASADEYDRLRDVTMRRRCTDCLKPCSECVISQAKNLASEQLCKRCRLCQHHVSIIN